MSVNLLPWRQRQQNHTKMQLIISGIIGALIIGACVITTNYVFHTIEQDIQQGNNYLRTQIQKQSTANPSKHARKRHLLIAIAKLMASHQQMHYALVSLLNNIKEDAQNKLTFSKIKLISNLLVLNGTATTPQAVHKFIQALKHCRYIQSLQIQQIAQQDHELQFSITGAFKHA